MSDSGTGAQRLTGAEAMPLLYALTADVARRTQTRVLAIKGVVLSEHELRAPRVSADIDVLMHPDDVEAFAIGMEAAGWRRAPATTTPKMLDFHSVNLLNDHWPMGVDAHVYFPGFLAPDAEVFDELWRRRCTVEQAGRQIPATDLSSSAAIAALHYLRSLWRPENAAAFETLIARSAPLFEGAAADDLVQCAQSTGSVLTLAPFLERLGIEVPSPVHPAEKNRIDHWRLATTSDPRMAWLHRFRSLRWYQWPAFFWKAIVMSEDELRAYHGDQTMTTPTWRLQVQRWRRMFSAVPTMITHERSRRRNR